MRGEGCEITNCTDLQVPSTKKKEKGLTLEGSIETLPLSVVQEILNGRLGAVDLARLESCSTMFRAPSGIAPYKAKSMAEAAAHHSCQAHPVFGNFPPHARLALLARCDGHWKQVLYFLECLLCMPGRSAPADARSNVVATTGDTHTLIVNGKGELYITSGTDKLSNIYRNIAPDPQSTLRLIFSQPTPNRILQISANFYHAAFITETGQVFTFGSNEHCCCGVGLESDQEILNPALVTALEMIPCQQVTTGDYFTIALTRSGTIYSWGYNYQGQLGHGHTRDESRPQEVIVHNDDGVPDPVVQVSTSWTHVVAVTKAGRLFTWGAGWTGCLGHNDSSNELRPKQVKHGGYAELFIVCASAGQYRSAAIDSSGLVYAWGWGCNYSKDSLIPVLIDNLKAYRAVQVVIYLSTFVVLDNGRVHYFGGGQEWSRDHCKKDQSGSFTIKAQKIQSISSCIYHGVMVSMSGAIFGFGWNNDHQLGIVDPSALSGDTILAPTEVFVAVTKFKGATELPNGSITT